MDIWIQLKSLSACQNRPRDCSQQCGGKNLHIFTCLAGTLTVKSGLHSTMQNRCLGAEEGRWNPRVGGCWTQTSVLRSKLPEVLKLDSLV